jgi:O-antigen/teichoic acid export membrane protein
LSDLKQKSINAIIWNLFEKYGIQLVSLVIGVILARLLTPADYGLIGMITVFFALAMVFVNSGFGAAYIQKKDATETDASTIFFFNIFVSILFYIVLWFSAPFIAKFYEQEQLISLTRVAAIVLIINSFGMMQISKLTKEVNFKRKSVISLASTIISGIIGITAALNNFGVWSLVIQQITMSLTNVLGLWIFYNWKPVLIFNIASLKSMFSFSAWILFSNIIKTIFDNIYILTIGKFFPAAQLGFYTKAKGYQQVATQQPASAISIVSFPVFSKLQNDKIALKNSMRKFLTHTLFFIAPISAILMVIAKPLILLLLTGKWIPMVPYFQLLLVIGFLYPFHLMNVQLLFAQGKSKLNFNISLIKNSFRIINIIVMYKYGVIYIIYGELIISFLALFINGYYTKKLIKYGIIEQLKDNFKILLISFFVILIGYFFVKYFVNDYSKIIIGLLSTGGCYLLLQYYFNRVFFKDNLVMLKSKILDR